MDIKVKTHICTYNTHSLTLCVLQTSSFDHHLSPVFLFLLCLAIVVGICWAGSSLAFQDSQ